MSSLRKRSPRVPSPDRPEHLSPSPSTSYPDCIARTTSDASGSEINPDPPSVASPASFHLSPRTSVAGVADTIAGTGAHVDNAVDLAVEGYRARDSEVDHEAEGDDIEDLLRALSPAIPTLTRRIKSGGIEGARSPISQDLPSASPARDGPGLIPEDNPARARVGRLGSRVTAAELGGLGMSEIIPEDSIHDIIHEPAALRSAAIADESVKLAVGPPSRGQSITAWMSSTSAYLPWSSKRNKHASHAAGHEHGWQKSRLKSPLENARIAFGEETGDESALPTPNPFADPASAERTSRDGLSGSVEPPQRPTIRLVRRSTAGTSEGGETLLRSGTRSDRVGRARAAEMDTDTDMGAETGTEGEATPNPHRRNLTPSQRAREGGSLTPRSYLPDSPYVYPAHITASYGYASPNTAYTPTLPTLANLPYISDPGSDKLQPGLPTPPIQQSQDSMAYRASKHRLTHRQSPLPPELKTIERSPRHVISGSPIIGLDGTAGDASQASGTNASYWGEDYLRPRDKTKRMSAGGRKGLGRGLLEAMLREEYEWRTAQDRRDARRDEELEKAKKLLPTLPLVPRPPGAANMSRDQSNRSSSTEIGSETLIGSASEDEGGLDEVNRAAKMKRCGTSSTVDTKDSLPMPDFLRKSSLMRRFRSGRLADDGTETRQNSASDRHMEMTKVREPAATMQARPGMLDRLAGYASPMLPQAIHIASRSAGKAATRPGDNVRAGLKLKVPQLRSIYRSRNRWGKLKWVLLCSVMTVLGYGISLVIWSIMLWCRTIPLSEVSIVFDSDVIAFVTFAGSLCLANGLIGMTGTLLNSRPILAVYALLLWPCLLSLCFIGYTSYKRSSLQLDLKLNQAWSQKLDDEQRLRIQQAVRHFDREGVLQRAELILQIVPMFRRSAQLNCCGFFNPFHDATYSRSCYPRTALPGCKGNWLRFERDTLGTFSTVAFSVIPLHLLNIVASLLCSNHVNQLYGKGMTPKQYRLSLADVQANAAVAGVAQPREAMLREDPQEAIKG